jgi:hypothetical protein
MLPASSMLLDDYVFVQREVLAWKFLKSSCQSEKGALQCPLKPVQFGALNPHARASVSVTLQFVGREKVTIRGVERELNRLDLKSDSGDWALWLDDPGNQFKPANDVGDKTKWFETRSALALIDTRTARVLVTTLFFALGLGFLYIARRTLIAFLFAIFFAYLMDPAVSHLQKWTRGRGRAIVAIYLLLLILVITFFFFVGPQIARQAQHLSESLPDLLSNVSSGRSRNALGTNTAGVISHQRLKDFLVSHKAELGGATQRRVGSR